MFAAWLSSGLDPDHLTTKLGRLLGQLTGRQTRSGGEKKKGKTGDNKGARDRAIKKRLPGGVRGLFEGFDEDGAGTVSRHDMKVVEMETAPTRAGKLLKDKTLTPPTLFLVWT